MASSIKRTYLIRTLAVSLIAAATSGFIASPATAAATDFITTWDTSANPTISLPFVDTATDLNFSIDWGDSVTAGPFTQLSGATLTHSYTGSTATRAITISGSKLPGWNLSTVTTSAALLLSVDQWGGFRFGDQSSGGYFKDASSLTTVSALDTPNLAGVTNLRNMFDGNSALASITSANSWDTSSVTTMYGMFRDATVFDQDIGHWDTSNVQDMRRMFSGARDFNQYIGYWDTSNVTDMSGMFEDAVYFRQYIGGWDTSNVTDMSSMFQGSLAFDQYIGGWDTSQVTTMVNMFNDAVSFNQDIGGWDTSHVRFMTNMFEIDTSTYSRSYFNKEIGNWDTSQVVDMQYMFNGATDMSADLTRWCVADLVSFPLAPFYFSNNAPNLTSPPGWSQSICAPSPATLTSTTSGVVGVSWASRISPVFGVSPTGYTVSTSSTSDGTFAPVTAGTCATAPTSVATSCTISGLTPGSRVYVHITASVSGVTPSTSPATSPRSVIVSSYTPPAPAPTPTPSDSGGSTPSADTEPASSSGDLSSDATITQVDPLANCQISDSSGQSAAELELTITSSSGVTKSGSFISTSMGTCALKVPAGDRVTVGVSGFLPGTEVFAYLLPTPTSLGRTLTPASGRAEISALIPLDTPPGIHVLQLSGYLSETEPKIVTVGLTVQSPKATKTIALKLTYSGSSTQLTTTQRTEIRRYVTADISKSIRVVYSKKGSANAKKVALQRAKDAVSYIKKIRGVESVTMVGSTRIKESVSFVKSIK